MVSIGASFRMPTSDPSLLTNLAFFQWYNKSNTTKLEYDFYHMGLVHIIRHYAEFAAKFKTFKIADLRSTWRINLVFDNPRGKSPPVRIKSRMKNQKTKLHQP